MRKNCLLPLLIVLLASSPLWAQNPADRPLITVSGNAEVRVVPDEVILNLGVESFEYDLADAKQDNDRRVAAVLDIAKKLGVEAKHIATDHLSIDPRYEHQYKDRTFLGYVVRKTVVITLRDLGQFEALLSGALEAGANYVHGIDFRTTELRKHRDQARSLALDAAREKAEALAKQAGQAIGKPHSIREGYAGWWSSYGSWWGSHWSSMSQNVIQSAGSAPAQLEGPTAPGQIAVTAQVTVSYELK